MPGRGTSGGQEGQEALPGGRLDGPATRLRAAHPDHVWALDYQFDQTTNFRTLKLLNITDEFTKEALAIDVHRSITADDTVGRPRSHRGPTGGHRVLAHGQRHRADRQRPA